MSSRAPSKPTWENDWASLAHSAVDDLVVMSATHRPVLGIGSTSLPGPPYGSQSHSPLIKTMEFWGIPGENGNHSASILGNANGKDDIRMIMAELKSSMCNEMERLVRHELEISFARMQLWMKELLSQEYGVCKHIAASSDLAAESLRQVEELSVHQKTTKSVSAYSSTSLHQSNSLLRSNSRKSMLHVGEEIGSNPSELTTFSNNSMAFRSVLGAIQSCNIEELTSLLEMKADPNMIVPEYKPYNFRKAMSSFMSQQSSYKAIKSFKNVSMLTVAVFNDNIDIARLLVRFGARCDSRHSCSLGSLSAPWSGSVIFAAPVTQDVLMLKELIELKADPHEVNSDKSTLLSQCCYEQNEEMVACLLEVGVDFDIAAKSYDRPAVSFEPLHIATHLGCTGIVELLLEAKAMNTVNEERISPLHDSISLWHPQITYLLVAYGAQLVEAGDADGGPIMMRRASSLSEQGKYQEFSSTLELLFQSVNPLVWEQAARGLQAQEAQVRGLTTDDVLHFLKQKGNARTELMMAVFRARLIRYRTESMMRAS